MAQLSPSLFHILYIFLFSYHRSSSLFWRVLTPFLPSLWLQCGSRTLLLAGDKIYYCRLVPLGLWETFTTSIVGLLSPLVRTLSVRALKCSHKIHNKFSGTGPNTFFVGTLVVTQYSENIGMKPLFQSNKLKMI